MDIGLIIKKAKSGIVPIQRHSPNFYAERKDAVSQLAEIAKADSGFEILTHYTYLGIVIHGPNTLEIPHEI